MSKKYAEKLLTIQCLNLDCPRCGAAVAFECRTYNYGTAIRPHTERVRAMQNLIRDSFNDWTVRKILRERNFAK